MLKHRTVKSLAGLLLILVLCAAVLLGCGNEGTEGDDSGSAASG